MDICLISKIKIFRKKSINLKSTSNLEKKNFGENRGGITSLRIHYGNHTQHM